MPKTTRRLADTEPRFLDNYLPYLMTQAGYLISGQFRRHLAAKGIRFSVWRLLATLVGTQGLSIGELAGELLLQQPTVSKIVDRLVAEGLVTRKSSANDRRQVIVVLTARGRSLVSGLMREAEQHQNDVLAAYTKSEVDLLFRVLRNVLDRNGAHGWGKPALAPET